MAERPLAQARSGPLHRNEYRCDGCGEIYSFGWSEEEARAESRALFGDMPPSSMAIICDDCFDRAAGHARMGAGMTERTPTATFAIWKFPFLPPESGNAIAIAMPKHARLLHVAPQGAEGQPCIWALVDTAAELESRTFNIYATGQVLPFHCGRHRGTFLLEDGNLVFHLFETTPSVLASEAAREFF